MITDQIVVPEIHCDHCKTSIEGALNPLPGVETASVDVASTTVTVDYDASVVTRDELVATIVDQGYDVPS
ncbi:MAG: heavy-metal-associated domain-containing protein [Euzebyales bacterium]|nr:heavy-metal-associated domain-containing protein [Euzebyales bacterium]MDQ3343961.1 cation transporter [Actinomycetota bacterium]